MCFSVRYGTNLDYACLNTTLTPAGGNNYTVECTLSAGVGTNLHFEATLETNGSFAFLLSSDSLSYPAPSIVDCSLRFSVMQYVFVHFLERVCQSFPKSLSTEFRTQRRRKV